MKIVGPPLSISRCKFYLACNEILTSHELTNAEVEQLRETKESGSPDEQSENGTEQKKCYYNLWNVVGKNLKNEMLLLFLEI